MIITYSPGATPLDPDEINGLIPQFVKNQSQLNACEANNILEAEIWLTRKKFTIEEILTISFLRKLHKKMFSKTWLWAGQLRNSNKNIGCDKFYIQHELKNLLDDVLCQIQHKTYHNHEIAARFHHRLVKIHLFSNGNGRHARLAADVLLRTLNEPIFKWGGSFRNNSLIRERYIKALQSADRNDYEPLLNFLSDD